LCNSSKKNPTLGDLPSLKGKWEGVRSVFDKSFTTELEIYNDTVPLKGKWTFYGVTDPGVMSGTQTSNFYQGKINENGDFFIKWGPNIIELSLYLGEGKMRLDGKYWIEGTNGRMTLYKK